MVPAGVQRGAFATVAAALVTGAALLAGMRWHAAEGLAPTAAGAVQAPALAPVRAATGPVDAPQQGTAQPDPWLSPDLRERIDALWLEVGEVDTLPALLQRLEAAVLRHFAPGEQARAWALVQRYVAYRAQLAELRGVDPHPTDPQALRALLARRQELRERHFDADERRALFEAEATLEQLALARLEIRRNPALTAAQKHAALHAAEAELPPAVRQERGALVEHMAVADHTRALQAQGADAATLHRERTARWGSQAADRLAALDQHERDWQARLDLYLSQGADLKAPDRQALRERLFTPEERLRLDAAPALRGDAPAQPQGR